RTHQRAERCLVIELQYGDRERAIPVDIMVFDERDKCLRSYNVKRGNGSYDGGKRRIIQAELLRTHMLLRNYVPPASLSPTESHPHIIFYYGLLSIPRPLALTGDDLDAHFNLPVKASIERVNSYFKEQLRELIDDNDTKLRARENRSPFSRRRFCL